VRSPAFRGNPSLAGSAPDRGFQAPAERPRHRGAFRRQPASPSFRALPDCRPGRRLRHLLHFASDAAAAPGRLSRPVSSRCQPSFPVT
jgi:hypothetical protein